jgi:hypothetical protein
MGLEVSLHSMSFWHGATGELSQQVDQRSPSCSSGLISLLQGLRMF